MSERKGKKIVRRRQTAPLDKPLPIQEYSIEHAFEQFITFKKTLGVRDRTMKDYHNIMKYFCDWLHVTYPEISDIAHITTDILRRYIIYLKEEKVNEKTNVVGLSPFTVNVRIRIEEVFFLGQQTFFQGRK